MHLRHTDAEMRHNLEKHEHAERRDDAAESQRQRPLLADGRDGGLEGDSYCGCCRGVAQRDFGAVDEAWFDVHVRPPAVYPDGGSR